MTTSHRCGLVWAAGAVLALAGGTRAGGPAAVRAVVGEAGLDALTVAGADVLGDGAFVLEKVVFRDEDGRTRLGEKTCRLAADGRVVRRTYPWGTIACEYAPKPGRCDLAVTVENASKATLQELWSRPLSLKLGTRRRRPRARTNIGAPSVLALPFDAGVLAAVNPDIDRPLHLGLGRPRGKDAAMPIQLRAGGDRMIYDRLGMSRPIPPGGKDTYRLSLRFGPADGDAHALAEDVYAAFAAAHPPKLDWADRRPICRVFVSGGVPEARAIRNLARGEAFEPSPAPEAFRTRMMDSVARAVYACRQIDAQGIVVWDIEGDVVPQITYVGDPRMTRFLNPAMDAVADEYFRAIRDGGLRCGVCIRPTQVVHAKSKGKLVHSYTDARDPFLAMDAKIAYAKKRWGCSLFYIDTNYFWRPRGPEKKWSAGMIVADVWRRLHARHPDVLLIPEHNYCEYWAVTAPYNEMDLGYAGVPGWVRRMYPEAFCVAVVEDADPHEHWDRLVRLGREGDCLMTFTYGITRNARAIRDARTEGKLLDAGAPEKVASAAPPELVAMLRDEALAVRFHAARRLGEVRAPLAVEALIARVRDGDEHWLVRKNAVLALGELKAAAATEALGAVLNNRKADLAHFATRALKRISTVVTPTQLDDTDPADDGLGPLELP